MIIKVITTIRNF